MKTLMLAICIFLFMGNVHAENLDTNTTNICPGNWVLSKPSGWVVRNEQGLILPISATTEVLGCSQTPLPLTNELLGVSVSITCAPPNVENGLPDIKSLTIVCE